MNKTAPSSHSFYRKINTSWYDLERANKPEQYTEKTKRLGHPAKALMFVLEQKLNRKNTEIVFLNHKYISAITKCCKRQNQNIIKQLGNEYNIEYYRSTIHNGKKYIYSYSFCTKK